MKNLQLISLLLLSVFIFSCQGERIRTQNQNEVLDLLPGTWKINQVQLKAIDDHYTRLAGIDSDTTLFAFGTIEFDLFEADTNQITGLERNMSNVALTAQNESFDARITSLICSNECVIHLQDINGNPQNTDLGNLIENTFLISQNYEVNFLNSDELELTAINDRATQKIILERD